MTGILRDLRVSLRGLARSPAFTLTALLTLAVALGANTAMFGLVFDVLLRPLPFPEAERVAAVSVLVPPAEGLPERSVHLDRGTLEAWREEGRSVQGIAEVQGAVVTLRGQGRSYRLRAERAAADLFPLLGVAPARGRAFGEDAEEPGAEPVVVLGHRLWQQRFDGREGIAGDRIEIDGVPHTVLGVMPPGFHLMDPAVDLWLPLPDPAPVAEGTVQVSFVPAVVRLAPGATLARAEQEAQRILLRANSSAAAGMPELAQGRIVLEPLPERLVADVRPALWVLSAAVLLVLVIACANLASLLLARNAARRHEFAIRAALGGDRLQLARQVLTESTLLGLVGGLLAALLAGWTHQLLPTLLPTDVPRLEELGFDVEIVVIAVALSLLAGLAIGLVAVVRGSSGRLVVSLRGGVSEGRRERRTRGFLVVAEVALAVVLLVGTGVLVRNFADLVSVDLGFEPDGVLAVDLDLTQVGGTGSADSRLAGLLERMEAHPRVAAVGVVSHPPLTSRLVQNSFPVQGQPASRTLAIPQLTSSGYLDALGLRLAEGRWIDEEDGGTGAPVAVVNRAFVERYMGSLDPLRQRLGVAGNTLRVVGVVDDVRLLGFESESRPEVYVSYRDGAALPAVSADRLTLAVRAEGSPRGLAAEVRELLWDAAPELALGEVVPVRARLAASVARPRTYAVFLAAFAVMALVLASAGLYALVAGGVVAQTRDIGVRRALGAQRRDVLVTVLRRGAVLVLWGIGVGLVAALALAEIAARRFPDLPVGVVESGLAAAVLVLAIAGVATLLPARRALRIQPLQALREE